ncbi:cysteine desulfurase family protein [Litchfieldia alkalitelluris]|uniref:cysteine desulfurase family protein n=1 Tax=Litchfieldia alkalitelluris TaxID=304268 RepID=UPI00099803DC|nr:cysteine desulfurase family protein [Litchfieldia alkalitelluris]
MIYLDNSATTKPYNEVLASFVKVAENYYGNPSSLHGVGAEAEKLLMQARKQAAELLDILPQEVVFTGGGSEGNNLAIKGVALKHKHRGNHIITTSVEHPSVSEACEQLKEHGFEITYLPVNHDGMIELEDVKNAIKDTTILVSMIHVNNEIGAIQPIRLVGEFLKIYPKILFHVDHVQGIGKVPLSFKDLGIDLCTISAHKFNGLKGTGILYVRSGIQLSPLISGGEQEMQFRSGTENVAGVVAMTKALRITLENKERTIEKLEAIKCALIEGLLTNPVISINTPTLNSAPHIINFSIGGLKAEVFVHLLEEYGIIVSTTSACSSKKKMPSKTLLAMNKGEALANSAIRISLSGDNQLEEVPSIVKSINEATEKLGRVMR